MEDTNEKSHGTADRELVIRRILNAPRELVYKVWTDPVHVAKWWGPNGFTTTIQLMNVQPGGEWNLVMHGPDGTDYKNKSVYVEVVKNELLVIDHISGPTFRMTVTFAEHGDKTLLCIQMLFDTPQQLDMIQKEFRAGEGLVQNVDKLEAYLAKTEGALA